MKTKAELLADEYTLVKTDDYRRLLKVEKHLMSIREGKDYNWLTEEYNKVDAYIDDMEVIKFDID